MAEGLNHSLGSDHLEAVANAAALELGGVGAFVRRPFDPAAHELDATFRLTKYADLKG